MILVTVGTHTDGFERLVREMDRIAFQLDEEVVIQKGATSYTPRVARWFDYAPQSEMERLSREARVIVSHSGSGSILTALAYGKPLIVMPRLHKYGEHMDDHQLEIAGALAELGMLLVANEAEELEGRLREAGTFVPAPSRRGRLLDAVRQAVLVEVPRLHARSRRPGASRDARAGTGASGVGTVPSLSAAEATDVSPADFTVNKRVGS